MAMLERDEVSYVGTVRHKKSTCKAVFSQLNDEDSIKHLPQATGQEEFTQKMQIGRLDIMLFGNDDVSSHDWPWATEEVPHH